MLKQYLFNELYTVLVAVLLCLTLSLCFDAWQLISLFAGILGFCLVFTIYYISCLRFFDRDTPQILVARTVIGFVLKVVLTVSYFVFLHRYSSLNLKFAALAFVATVLISSFIAIITAKFKTY